MTFWDQDGAGSGGTDGRTARERPGGRLVIIILVALALLVAAGYAGAYALAGDKVPRGTSISGVDVGGLSRAAAQTKLEDAFRARAEQPIEVSVVREGSDAARSMTLQSDQIGIEIDYAASVEAAGAEKSWRPQRLWNYFTGGDDVDAVVDFDEAALDQTLDTLSEGLGTPPKNGAVAFTADGVMATDPTPGEAIDRDQARTAIVDALLGAADTAELTVAPAEPDIDDADVAQALTDFANPAMSAPVTLVFGKSEVRLQPRQFAPALSMQAQDGQLVPVVDEKRLTKLVKHATTSGEPVDATVRLVNGRPRVVPGKPGVEFEPAAVTEVFLGLLGAADGDRSAEVDATVVDPEFTTKDARDLGIKQKIAEFSTYYPHADYRNINLGRAAELVDGTLLKPGETFSLNGIVGERTVENGFTSGYIISNGILKKDLGGGVSQMATTLFNGMFFAGLEDVEHKPHSFYIDRYPVGREATVAWPTLDLQFKNDTDYGVLVHATVKPSTYSSQGVVTVQMFSTKVWDIESVTGNRYNYRAPATRTLTTPDCEAFTGYSGFDIDVTRIFRKHGEDSVDHKEKFHTAYTPADSVVCKKPDAPKKPKQD